MLADPSIIKGEDCKFHLISHSSTLIKRVCRATVQAEAYQLQYSSEEGDRIRAAIAAMRGQLDSKDWEATAAASFQQIWFTDCKSVHDSLINPVMAKMADKRLSIEIASMRQSLWRERGQRIGEPTVQDEMPSHPTDIVRWIDTDVMLADPLTKQMEANKLVEAMDSNTWNIRQPIESVIKKRAKQLARRKNPETATEEKQATDESDGRNDSDQEHSMTSMD